MLIGVSLPRPAAAQWQVIDMANLGQAVLQVSHLVQMLGLHVKDLSALAQVGQLVSVLDRLNAVANRLQSLMAQVDARAFGWNGLASMSPCGSAALAEWNYQAASWARQAAALMQQVSSLSSETLGLLNEMMTLITSIVGTTSGLQTITGLMAQLVTETQTMRAIAIPFQQEMQGGRIMEQVNQLASICLQRSLLQGWGTTRTW